MKQRKNKTVPVAAARAGISTASGYRIEQDPQLPSQKQQPRGRRRPDPLAGIFDEEVVPLLVASEGKLRPVAIYHELLRRHPDLDAGIRRTLERRVRHWRAHHGPAQAVMFRQEHTPGRLALSDFTDMASSQITIGGEAFAHRLYHFRLAFSGYEFAHVILGGESYIALAAGLQQALWSLGGVPQEHRTDSLSAAYRNLQPDQREDLTRRYEALCAHYGMTPSRNNPGEAHENGSIEAQHGHLRAAIEDALLLRGSRDFEDVSTYRRFVAEVVSQQNKRRDTLIEAERQCLSPLPANRTDDFEEVSVRVTSSSGFTLRKVFYSVPSRLIGHRLKVRLFDDRLEVFLGSEHLMSHARGRPQADGRHGHVVDYRHVIHALRRKPMALMNLTYREQLFPRRAYRETFDVLCQYLPPRRACQQMVALLALAHERTCEAALAAELTTLLGQKQLPDLNALTTQFASPTTGARPDVDIKPVSLADYANLQQNAMEVPA